MHNFLVYLDIDGCVSFAGCHTVYVQRLSTIQNTFPIIKLNPCLDRPAIAEVIEVRPIHYGIDI